MVELTEEQREIMAQLERELGEHFAMLGGPKPIEESAVVALARAQSRCDEINAWPLADRLHFLAEIHDGDLEAIERSIADVTFEARIEFPTIVVTAKLLLARAIEQVYCTVRVE